MTLHTVGKYQIDIYKDYTFTRGSADNVFSYDFEYFGDSSSELTTVFGIKIFEDDELLDSVVIGASRGVTVYHQSAVIFEEDRFLLCCSDTIFCLSIPDLVLLWKTKVNSPACFEIFKYKETYIVHGEIGIAQLDKNGNIVWQIFVAMDDRADFILEKDYILVRDDYDNRIYKFDYDGNSIND
ncbi:hypothetical protein [Emticicia sp. C21]|uniref:hypothetical protein n=1 Tax=Emticicia sp. C21 TaxID=2302915 RepID=UPI000E8B3E10|nr:hypothetical protein [Emticicia sp. C21]RFS13301.1 hypothetical protein D0T08_27280 [Emticicia sp. C21]